MKEAANVWEYKVGINATFCLFVNMLIDFPITPHDQQSQKCSPFPRLSMCYQEILGMQ